MISTDYDDASKENVEEHSLEDVQEPFLERNQKVFTNITIYEQIRVTFDEMLNIKFCDTIEDLMALYYTDFSIEGLVLILFVLTCK